MDETPKQEPGGQELDGLQPRDGLRRDPALVERWLETQRGRPQARAARTAGWSANAVLRPLARQASGTKAASSLRRLREVWPDAAGRLAKMSRPVRVQGTKAGRTLVVEALGPAATLVQADAGRILARINARLGADAVGAIRVVQGRMERDAPMDAPARRGLTPLEERDLNASLHNVSDPGLREALERMGRNVIGDRRD